MSWRDVGRDGNISFFEAWSWCGAPFAPPLVVALSSQSLPPGEHSLEGREGELGLAAGSPKKRVVLDLQALVKHYATGAGDPVRAVDGVSLSISQGELVAIYGPSGSGKTTLLTLIAGLQRPDSGSVIVDGRVISGLSEDERARYRLRELGYVDQVFDLLEGATAVQNAALKLWLTDDVRRAEALVEPLLLRLGLGERLRHRPGELSMGERQRVMVARALSTEPKLLLADEPTGSLDTRRGREVLQLMSEICRERGTAVLLVTHDPQAAGFADRVHVLRDGRLADYQPTGGTAFLGERPSC
jgi:putative ABC transport system ATP-binding protein